MRSAVSRVEIQSAVLEYKGVMEFLGDLDAGLFGLTLGDYKALPATLVDAVRILRRLRNEQKKDGPLGT
jgi:hypothetical protein